MPHSSPSLQDSARLSVVTAWPRSYSPRLSNAAPRQTSENASPRASPSSRAIARASSWTTIARSVSPWLNAVTPSPLSTLARAVVFLAAPGSASSASNCSRPSA
jgi:hypothetical protein